MYDPILSTAPSHVPGLCRRRAGHGKSCVEIDGCRIGISCLLTARPILPGNGRTNAFSTASPTLHTSLHRRSAKSARIHLVIKTQPRTGSKKTKKQIRSHETPLRYPHQNCLNPVGTHPLPGPFSGRRNDFHKLTLQDTPKVF